MKFFDAQLYMIHDEPQALAVWTEGWIQILLQQYVSMHPTSETILNIFK